MKGLKFNKMPCVLSPLSLILFLITLHPAIVYSQEMKEQIDPNTISVIPKSPQQILSETQNHLVSDFNRYLKSANDYDKLVRHHCRLFPEGDLFPYVYPAMAYVNVALKDPTQRENSVLQSQKLIDLAIAAVTKRVRPPGGQLENLHSYQNHATYLGQLNLAIGAYYLISDDDRYDRLHKILSGILHEALVQTEGRSLNSFPEYSWPFDTIPVLVSLHLYDNKTSVVRSEQLIKKHLTWIRSNATHPVLKLPYSRIYNTTGQGREFPRGCDLSLRLCLLPHIDPHYSKEIYENYTKKYWIDNGVLKGFAEWPNGMAGFEDIDSGPILMGVGLGATGLGLGTTIAMGDDERCGLLCEEMLKSAGLIRLLLVGKQSLFSSEKEANRQTVPLDAKYFSGFLFGDAMLFYCATWQPWIKHEDIGLIDN